MTVCLLWSRVSSLQPRNRQRPHQTSSRGVRPGPPGVPAGPLPKWRTPADQLPVELVFVQQLQLAPHGEQPQDPASRLQHRSPRPARLPPVPGATVQLQEHAGTLLPGDGGKSGTVVTRRRSEEGLMEPVGLSMSAHIQMRQLSVYVFGFESE